MSIDNVVYSLISLRTMFGELGYPQRTITVLQDNQSAIKVLMKNDPITKNLKHVQNKIHFLNAQQKKKIFDLEYCETEKMTADILTKPLTGSLFRNLRRDLMNEL